MTAPVTTRVRRTVRRAVWRVRCESRPVSRYVFNLLPVARYRGPGGLGPAATELATELRAQGVALGSAAQLVGEDLVEAVVGRCEDLAAPALAQHASRTSLKTYLHQLLGRHPALDPVDPLVAFALHPRVRGVAEAYAGMTLRLQDLNVWLTAPTGDAPQHSQRWHRDLPEDHDIVKCFFYARDVPAGAGPLHYVRRSHTLAARRAPLPTTFDGIGYRIDDASVERVAGPGGPVVAVGTAGTVAFADTRGLHRGGYARDCERLVVQIAWASAATTRPRVLRPAAGVARSQLPGVRLQRRPLPDHRSAARAVRSTDDAVGDHPVTRTVPSHVRAAMRRWHRPTLQAR